MRRSLQIVLVVTLLVTIAVVSTDEDNGTESPTTTGSVGESYRKVGVGPKQISPMIPISTTASLKLEPTTHNLAEATREILGPENGPQAFAAASTTTTPVSPPVPTSIDAPAAVTSSKQYRVLGRMKSPDGETSILVGTGSDIVQTKAGGTVDANFRVGAVTEGSLELISESGGPSLMLPVPRGVDAGDQW